MLPTTPGTARRPRLRTGGRLVEHGPSAPTMLPVERKRIAIISGAIAAVLALVIGVTLVVRSGGESEPQAAPTTTSTTATTAPAPTDEYQVATARVASVDVLLEPPPGVTPAPGGEVRQTSMQPIPRSSLNSAGVRVIPGGFQYDNPTYFGNPLLFDVVSTQGDWVEVEMQARPNGQRGWVRASDVEIATYDAVIELDLTTKVLTARLDGEEILRTPATIGLPSNPTPTGTYYIFEEIPQSYTGGPFGPMIMATSAYSERLDLFENGLPIVALHGTNEPNLIGQPASNGCIRIDNDLIIDLAERMPPGVPLIITESAVAGEAQPQAA